MTIKRKTLMTEQEIINHIKPAQREALGEIALLVQAVAKKSIFKISPGRKYQRGRGFHTASRPGDPPNTDTGLLASSIQWRIEESGEGLSAIIGSGLEYARDLELGIGVAARPFLQPAVDDIRIFAKDIIAEAIGGKS